MECTHYHAINKGSILGAATIVVKKWGLEIAGVTLWQGKNNNRWVSMPSRSYEKDGQKKYIPYLRMSSEEIQKKFLEMALKAVEEKWRELDSTPPEQERASQQDAFDEDIPF